MSDADTAMAVQRMQEYIEANIAQAITLRELAAAAGYSPWHAARLFSEATGKAPFEYIRARRLTKAALVLRDESPRVVDVALDFVFDSHEGFTRAFSRAFGITPSSYRESPPAIKLFLPAKVYDTYRAVHKEARTMTMERATSTVFVQVIERPARKVLMKRGTKAEHYFAYCDEVGCDVWSVLSSVKEALYEPIGMWLPKHLIASGTSKYVQGVELPTGYSKPIPEGYEMLELPPCTMMVFQGEPYNDDDFSEAIDEVWAHIDRFDPTVYGYHWAPENAPRFQLAPMGYRGYIEARPVSRVQ